MVPRLPSSSGIQYETDTYTFPHVIAFYPKEVLQHWVFNVGYRTHVLGYPRMPRMPIRMMNHQHHHVCGKIRKIVIEAYSIIIPKIRKIVNEINSIIITKD